jgi:lipopolysaccharide export system ATP-binding protein
MAFLTVEKLSQSLGKKHILQSVCLEVSHGTIAALLGPNGAGKTTLLKTIIGLYQAPHTNILKKQNLIFLEKELINAWPIYKRVESGLAYLPQHTSLFQQMTVLDNLKLVFDYHPTWRQQPWSSFQEEYTQWLDHTALTATIKQQVATLSGGQKRKLEVVRTLLMHPRGIMLDEPFAGIDPKSIYELKKIFTGIAQTGIAILISDHHVDQLLSMAQQMYVLLNGQVVCSGKTKDILENNLTKDSYLGNQFYEEMAQRFL